MNYTDIQARLAIIKSLPISELDKRQPLLVALAAGIVNGETSDGNDTDGSNGLEYQDWWHTLGALMRDAGFRMLGNGHFSAAYSHELLPGRVIKVGFKKEDSGAAYTAFCRMHQGRAGIPNVYHVARHAGCYTVVLDRLKSCDDDNYDHEAYADLARYFVESDCHDANDFAPGDYEFIETCKMIREFFKGIASFDMHRGNIMFDDNDVPYITDPVSFSHDREREDGFPLDPEALLAEVEAVAQERMIERCRNRKAKCDPNGTFQVNRKAAMKRRKRNRKLRAKRGAEVAQHFVQRRREQKQELRDAMRAQDWMGAHNWHNMWLHNNNADVIMIDKVKAFEWKQAERMALMQCRSLPIDKLLDAQLQG